MSIVCRREKAKAEGEAADFIAFILPLHLFFAFSAQKSHVKPQNYLTHYQSTTSTWHFSYVQPAILDI
jgi:hypothetical protein